MEKKTIEITVYNQDDIPERRALDSEGEPIMPFSEDILIKNDMIEYDLGYYDYDYNIFCYYDNIFTDPDIKFTWVYAEDVFK